MEPDIPQLLIDQLKGHTYLEIGVDHGHSFWPIRAKRKIGVDPKFLRVKFLERIKRKIGNKLLGREELFFQMTSNAFFSEKSGLFSKNKIDVALIDGLHTYEQSLRDLLNCLNYLQEKGILILDDCNPPSEVIATPAPSFHHAANLNLSGWDGRWCGDVWKTIVYLRSCRPDLTVFVLDRDYGIGIVTRGKPEDMLAFSPGEIQRMSYADLDKDRKRLLDLKNIIEFKEI